MNDTTTNLSLDDLITPAPTKAAKLNLGDKSILTICTLGGRRTPAIITDVQISAEEYPSDERGADCAMVRTVNVTCFGRYIKNYAIASTLATLAREDLIQLQDWAKSNEPVLSEGDDAIIFTGRIQYEGSTQWNKTRKGEEKMSVNWTGAADPRFNNLPINAVVNDSSGATTYRTDSVVMSEVDSMVGLLRFNLKQDSEWIEIFRAVDDGGYVQIRKTNAVEDSGSEEALKELQESIAATAGSAPASEDDGDI